MSPDDLATLPSQSFEQTQSNYSFVVLKKKFF